MCLFILFIIEFAAIHVVLTQQCRGFRITSSSHSLYLLFLYHSSPSPLPLPPSRLFSLSPLFLRHKGGCRRRTGP